MAGDKPAGKSAADARQSRCACARPYPPGAAPARGGPALAASSSNLLLLSLVDKGGVRQVKSLKRRAGWPVLWLCSWAAASSSAISALRRAFLAKPNRKSTALFSHQVI